MDQTLPYLVHADPESPAAPQTTLEEELAGPPLANPVAAADRIPIVDVIRGFALLGILLMNIPAFSGPRDMSNHPTSVGHHDALNLSAWAICTILFEGKMRGAFSMLFGAGVILLTDRAEARGLSARVGEIFARRNLWLLLFGVLDGYLLWFGDILYAYALIALIFLFPFRRAAPRLLWSAGLFALLLAEIPMGSRLFEEVPQSRLVASAQAAQKSGKKLTKEQSEALKADRNEKEKNQKERAEDLHHMRGGYWEITQLQAKEVNFYQTQFVYFFGFGDVLGMMLIGMALLRSGFLTGALPNRIYWRTMAICFPIVIGVVGWGAMRTIEADFSELAYSFYIYIPYQATRLLGTLANISVMILLCKKGWFKPLTRALAAVGQMALTNYILTSVLCVFYFYGFGFRRYGQLEYYQLFYVVAVVWIVLLVFSSYWLQYFRFGPMEWLWRSLTYWQRQPMRLRPTAIATRSSTYQQAQSGAH